MIALVTTSTPRASKPAITSSAVTKHTMSLPDSLQDAGFRNDKREEGHVEHIPSGDAYTTSIANLFSLDPDEWKSLFNDERITPNYASTTSSLKLTKDIDEWRSSANEQKSKWRSSWMSAHSFPTSQLSDLRPSPTPGFGHPRSGLSGGSSEAAAGADASADYSIPHYQFQCYRGNNKAYSPSLTNGCKARGYFCHGADIQQPWSPDKTCDAYCRCYHSSHHPGQADKDNRPSSPPRSEDTDAAIVSPASGEDPPSRDWLYKLCCSDPDTEEGRALTIRCKFSGGVNCFLNGTLRFVPGFDRACEQCQCVEWTPRLAPPNEPFIGTQRSHRVPHADRAAAGRLGSGRTGFLYAPYCFDADGYFNSTRSNNCLFFDNGVGCDEDGYIVRLPNYNAKECSRCVCKYHRTEDRMIVVVGGTALPQASATGSFTIKATPSAPTSGSPAEPSPSALASSSTAATTPSALVTTLAATAMPSARRSQGGPPTYGPVSGDWSAICNGDDGHVNETKIVACVVGQAFGCTFLGGELRMYNTVHLAEGCDACSCVHKDQIVWVHGDSNPKSGTDMNDRPTSGTATFPTAKLSQSAAEPTAITVTATPEAPSQPSISSQSADTTASMTQSPATHSQSSTASRLVPSPSAFPPMPPPILPPVEAGGSRDWMRPASIKFLLDCFDADGKCNQTMASYCWNRGGVRCVQRHQMYTSWWHDEQCEVCQCRPVPMLECTQWDQWRKE